MRQAAALPACIIDEDLAIACGVDAVRPTVVQRPGKSAMARRDFLAWADAHPRDAARLNIPMRYRILIEYDGTPFIGWQMQSTGVSVQSAIGAALKELTGTDAKVYGAGRTDAGVHAMGQVAHFDLDRRWDARPAARRAQRTGATPSDRNSRSSRDRR